MEKCQQSWNHWHLVSVVVVEVGGEGIGAKEGCVKQVQDEMKDSRGNRKIGPDDDRVGWGGDQITQIVFH